jgi:predicted nuclease with TOPRIM domain
MEMLHVLEEKLKDLVERIHEMKEQNKELREQASRADGENKELKSENARLAQENAQLALQLTTVQDSVMNGREHIVTLNQERTETKKIVDDLIQRIDLLAREKEL